MLQRVRRHSGRCIDSYVFLVIVYRELDLQTAEVDSLERKMIGDCWIGECCVWVAGGISSWLSVVFILQCAQVLLRRSTVANNSGISLPHAIVLAGVEEHDGGRDARNTT